ncbi:MAG: phosphate ABC transporter ATP-binding protein PstB [Pseudomonadota bacterium]
MNAETVIEVQKVGIWYGENKAVKDINLSIERQKVFALIGPSGCGKSTLLRCFNRMNDFVDGFRIEGSISYRGMNIYDKKVDPVVVRKCIGMVFQKPNPFPSSIFENIAWAPRINGYKGDISELVETSLTKAGLWKEVKDRLKSSGFSLSGGQQQRLCIARTIAMQPDVILMDEPCSALDPISTSIIEDLIAELKKQYSIVIVTHSMQQAARVSDQTAFLYRGDLIEMGDTSKIFSMPDQKLTKEYISGKFG